MEIKYTKITFLSDYKLPFTFIGSTIRGAFGYGLKRVVCINPSFKCDGCFAKDNCLYYDLYEKSFNKFRFAFKLDGKLNFDLYLFEEISNKTPYILSSIYKAFKEIGILRDRIKIDDFKILVNDEIVYDGEFKECKMENVKWKMEDFSHNDELITITLNFITPLRIKQDGKYVRGDELNPISILRSIYHRYLKLKDKKPQKLPFMPDIEVIDKNLKFIDYGRYSNRQKTKMKLGGVVGEMKLKVDENSYKLFKLGEIIGVGKQVTFGLGNMRVIDER
ncbi:CRISPR system precrRNA processing endoribonuclease RAMP protein Cas6 [Caminibacter mediatlanticus TB-2]|uniref:CRISPR system precrRNA processing endoribonuclease RAMP protein Cas6 n=1 Tax=Caminibacter mediatlanticus TB-2 TaxID=391592 RepID=A0ABX5VAN9_9BACT|nr:CRISPR system precrRNA processing endoribonuclease RAMP protein Cas6 [Caminibacter mediatlanticus]QCT95328.1 CRISPR system precrRNA processing endoribonuclease RAMP protein Cas6 [Caminibacter mediatlanticus TB-2]